MLDSFVWRPLSDSRSLPERLLESKLRAALPKRGDPTKAGAEQTNGEVERPQSSGPVSLQRLLWEIRRPVRHLERPMHRWQARGTALVHHQIVDFTAELLRDDATGAFYQVELYGMERFVEAETGSHDVQGALR